jgi:hypothetical protein
MNVPPGDPVGAAPKTGEANAGAWPVKGKPGAPMDVPSSAVGGAPPVKAGNALKLG